MQRQGGWGGLQGNKPKFEYKKPAERAPPKAPQSQATVLQEGLVIVRGLLSLDKQNDIVKQCLELGNQKQGGFYVPKPKKDAKENLKLKIMCLGYHWNSEERCYQPTREDNDNAIPHPIPNTFFEYCKLAVDASKQGFPAMPDINPTVIICNLYSENGALGWHKDDDEDPDTITDGLPVVSLSVGNSCIFSYKTFDKQVREVILASGDALVFGGPSRLVPHTVKEIIPNTSPVALMHGLRLNLTFREHTRKKPAPQN